jgi:type VI secretion system protein ImpG
MDPRMLRYYNRELQHIREMGVEFAQQFPKIAQRLGMEGLECADPYVERLLEGFAFLAARVQLRLDAEFPRFTQQLLEVVYPHYLAPTPSMAVVQFRPELGEGALAAGFSLPRGTALHAQMGKEERTVCDYRTAHEVTLWPLELVEAQYLATAATLAAQGWPDLPGARAGVRLRLRATAGMAFSQIALDRLVLYLRGTEDIPAHLYEQLLGNGVGVLARPVETRQPWCERLPRSALRRVGFGDEEAVLPAGPRSFQGYRLLHEYFAFPERFLFVEIAGLKSAVRRCTGGDLEVLVVLGRSDPVLENALDAGHFGLFCAPAVNLFPRRADRIHLSARQHEYHLVVDRTRPMDFEVHTVVSVSGHGSTLDSEQPFFPLYSAADLRVAAQQAAYYTLRRERRLLSARQRLQGPRSSYVGGEVFLSLVDAAEAPYRSDLRQLAVTTLCTNRDLPINMPLGKGRSDFTLESGAPVDSVRVVAGPTKPRPSWGEGDTAWRLISHLSLNYLSIADASEAQGAAALRELLGLYADLAEPGTARQIEGVRSVAAAPIVRRMPVPGPISFGRGLQVTLTCDEAAFHGAGGIFLLGAVLEEFFARYVSLNSFTETVVRAVDRGEIMRWPARIGRRQPI